MGNEKQNKISTVQSVERERVGELECEVHRYVFKEKEEGIEWINDKDQKGKSQHQK